MNYQINKDRETGLRPIHFLLQPITQRLQQDRRSKTHKDLQPSYNIKLQLLAMVLFINMCFCCVCDLLTELWKTPYLNWFMKVNHLLPSVRLYIVLKPKSFPLTFWKVLCADDKLSLFTQIHKNNHKCCMMHAKPVVGDVTL